MVGASHCDGHQSLCAGLHGLCVKHAWQVSLMFHTWKAVEAEGHALCTTSAVQCLFIKLHQGVISVEKKKNKKKRCR